MISVTAIIQLFLAFCGGISCLGAALAYIAKAIGWIKKPEIAQNEILDNHEKRITKLEEQTKDDYDDIKKLQKEVKMVLKAVVAIMKHEIDGNNKSDLEKVQGEITDYLVEK